MTSKGKHEVWSTEELHAEIASLRNQVSKKQRKCNALRDAVDHLAEKLAAVRSSLKNKKSQIARLIREKTRLIREKNGEMPIDDPQPSD